MSLMGTSRLVTSLGMVDETDTRWASLTEPEERLRWARARLFETQEAFANSIGMKRGAYRKYEAGPAHDGGVLKADKAMQFAKKLKVRWEWLLYGQGVPFLDTPTPAQRVDELLRDLPLEEQERYVSALELLVRRTGTEG
jgi:transcriptional regulator with XRE-family HTH domain